MSVKEITDAKGLMAAIADIPVGGVDNEKVEALVREGKSLAEATATVRAAGGSTKAGNARSNIGSRIITLIKAGKVVLVDAVNPEATKSK